MSDLRFALIVFALLLITVPARVCTAEEQAADAQDQVQPAPEDTQQAEAAPDSEGKKALEDKGEKKDKPSEETTKDKQPVKDEDAKEPAPAKTDEEQDPSDAPLSEVGQLGSETAVKQEAAENAPEDADADKDEIPELGEKLEMEHIPYERGLTDEPSFATEGDEEEAAKPVGSPDQRNGFYISIRPSIGYLYFSGQGESKQENLDDPYSQGVAGMLDLAVGGGVTENLILHASLSVDTAFSEIENVDSRKQASMIGIGLGMTYYFMPDSFFISPNLSYTQTKMLKSSEGTSQAFDTANGVKFTVLGGKEWWVGDRFSLGVAAKLIYGWSKKDVLTWNIYGGGLVFVITYN